MIKQKNLRQILVTVERLGSVEQIYVIRNHDNSTSDQYKTGEIVYRTYLYSNSERLI